MATPFDATAKTPVEIGPRDWLTLLGLPATACEVIDADLSTVSTEADRLIRVLAPKAYIVHIEFQTGHDGAAFPPRGPRYNVISFEEYGLPIETCVFLLRPEADSPALNGVLELKRTEGTIYLRFEYRVVRVWQLPVAKILSGGVALLPFAPVADLSGMTPEAVVTKYRRPLEPGRRTGEERNFLWTAVYLLMGLRYTPQQAAILLRGVRELKESSTYQAILNEGREEGRGEGERRIILRQGTKRFGPPSEIARAALESLSWEKLEALSERIFEAETWDEFLT